VRAPDRSRHKVTTRRKKLHRVRDASGSQPLPRSVISLTETRKLSHCIGRTVVRLLWKPHTLVECSPYGTIIDFELQQLIWIKFKWAYLARLEATDLLATLHQFPAVASNQAPRQRNFYVTQP
jgi:hypothetical protein